MIALASLNGFHYPSDIESSSRWYENGADLSTSKWMRTA